MPTRQGLVVEGECDLRPDLDTGYYVVLRSCKIGSGVGIWSHSIVDPGVMIGNNVRIQAHVYISSGTQIEDNVFIGPAAVFLNDKYPPRYDKGLWQPPIIRKGAVIGGRVTVCPGVEIGEGAKIGAGSVVTKNVPAGETWVGNPARLLNSDRRKLLGAMEVSNVHKFKLETMEATGYLVLMVHWLRGLFAWVGEHVQMTDVERDNWRAVVSNIEAYEEYTWQVVPPRAMLSQLRAFRKAGHVEEDFLRLIECRDEHGRYGQGQARVPEDVADMIHRLDKAAKDG